MGKISFLPETLSYFCVFKVFDNTPASREGTLQSGDELVGVNGNTVKGKTKVEVAKMIQSCKVNTKN